MQIYSGKLYPRKITFFGHEIFLLQISDLYYPGKVSERAPKLLMLN